MTTDTNLNHRLQLDILLRNGNVVDSATGLVTKADVGIAGGVIAFVGNADEQTAADAEVVIDCTDMMVAPGFVDSHVHIESSMVLPATFGKAVLPWGTTTVIADPHELVNVGGAEALRLFLSETDKAQVSIFTVVPSCVPSTAFETNGAGHFTAEQMKPFLHDKRIVGLGEVMSFGDVVNGDLEMLAKLSLFKGRPIDGHTAGIDEALVDAYVSHGISNDHECYDEAGVLARYHKGMNIYIREGSAARNADALLACVKKHRLDVAKFSFCTDDKHLSTIAKEGHISYIVRKALLMGFTWGEVAKMASLNPCQYYHLDRRGNVREGYVADVVITDRLCSAISCVIKDGNIVKPSSDEKQKEEQEQFANTVKFRQLSALDFQMTEVAQRNAIKIVDGQLLTERVQLESGQYRGMNMLATVERHGKNGNIAVCPLLGYGIIHGAVATSVAHDSHNVICAADSAADMAVACNRLREIGGGYVIVSKGEVVDEFALPCYGLMSALGIHDAIAGISRLERKAQELGVNPNIDPFITLSFLALPVIPEIRLLDTGLYDVTHSQFLT